MTEIYADSTVAISVYNIICKSTGNISSPAVLLDIIDEHCHPGLTGSQLRRVMRRMVRRGVLNKNNKTYIPCDPKRRIVVTRNRDDVYEDDKGRIRGGWENWMCQDPVKGLVPLQPMPKKHEIMKGGLA